VEVIQQVSRNYEAPTTTMVGAPGTEVWVFNTLDTGLAIIKFTYSRPWEGGEQGLYTVTVNINVR
jgi:predicted secreted protein